MGKNLRDLGVSVSWSTELVGIEQEPDRVVATLKLPDWHQPDDPRRVGGRMRWSAQLGAEIKRH